MGDTLNEQVMRAWQRPNALKSLDDPVSAAVLYYPFLRLVLFSNYALALRLDPSDPPFIPKLTAISHKGSPIGPREWEIDTVASPRFVFKIVDIA